MGAEVFISYSSRDRDRVMPVVESLRGNGISVWVDEGNIHAADLWSEQIVQAIADCRVMVVMLSQNSTDSHNVVKEVMLASEQKKALLPVYLEPADIPAKLQYQLAGIQHLELYGENEQQVLEDLANGLAKRGITSSPLTATVSRPAASSMPPGWAAAVWRTVTAVVRSTSTRAAASFCCSTNPRGRSCNTSCCRCPPRTQKACSCRRPFSEICSPGRPPRICHSTIPPPRTLPSMAFGECWRAARGSWTAWPGSRSLPLMPGLDVPAGRGVTSSDTTTARPASSRSPAFARPV